MSKLASQSLSTTPTPFSLASNPILFSVIPCYSFSQPNGCRCGIKGIKSAGCRDKSLAQWYAGDEACNFFGGIFGVQNVMEIKDGVGEYGRKMAVDFRFTAFRLVSFNPAVFSFFLCAFSRSSFLLHSRQ
jgi:hypothetical protein